MEETVQKTWKPTVAGILDIISGVTELIGAVVVTLALIFIPVASSVVSDVAPEVAHWLILDSLYPLLILIPVLGFAGGTVSLIAGIYAVQRKKWSLALAGSIVAILGSTILGILATVFTVMAKDEFEA